MMTINNTRTTTARPAASDVPPTSAELKDLVADVKARTAEVADEVDRATDRLPEFVDTMRTNASDAARAVQTTPEPTLGIMTAASIGLAAGLLMAGAPRFVVATAAAPAAFIAAALLMRGRTPAR